MDNGDLLSLLGSLITAYIALNIFGKWKSQKGSEVVAIEAKEIFSLIEKIPSKLNTVLGDMLKMTIDNKVPNDFDTKNFKEFMEVNVEIFKRLELVKFKNKNKDTLKLINNFELAYEDFAIYYHRSSTIVLKELLDSKDTYKECFEALKKDMYEYALFKKTI
ncbi:MAG: hypothetical protein KAY38_01545 [Acinetobacter sp.]|nr:hypothetical protein [Acinetobacter sp.]